MSRYDEFVQQIKELENKIYLLNRQLEAADQLNKEAHRDAEYLEQKLKFYQELSKLDEDDQHVLHSLLNIARLIGDIG